MKFQKLGEDIYIPQKSSLSLINASDLKFNYYLNSRINGNSIDLDITSKLFCGDDMYVRKSCYRVRMGEIENCVKASIIDHMKSLGVSSSNIPESLKKKNYSDRRRSSKIA